MPKKPTRTINPSFEYFDSKGRLKTFSKKVSENPELRRKILAKVEMAIKLAEQKKAKKLRAPRTMPTKEVVKILLESGFRQNSPTQFFHPKYGGISFAPKPEIQDRKIMKLVLELKNKHRD